MKRISRENVIYKFTNNMKAIDEINPGDRIIVETNDCWSQQIESEDQLIDKIDYDILNPATGPIYIKGAEPGDVVKVKIEDININNWGSALTVPNEGVLGDQVGKPLIRIMDIKDNYVEFKEGIKIPVKPMIGVIGVAPAEEDGDWDTAAPWKHGGNMDTSDIGTDSTLYFPVNQEGALLALGDCHGVMGDGEICFTGLEVSAEVTLKVDLIKDKKLEWPILETDKEIMVLASGHDTDDAIYKATDMAVKYISKTLDLDWEEAYILTSLAVDIRISQLVDPKITIRSVLPKYLFNIDDLFDFL